MSAQRVTRGAPPAEDVAESSDVADGAAFADAPPPPEAAPWARLLEITTALAATPPFGPVLAVAFPQAGAESRIVHAYGGLGGEHAVASALHGRSLQSLMADRVSEGVLQAALKGGVEADGLILNVALAGETARSRRVRGRLAFAGPYALLAMRCEIPAHDRFAAAMARYPEQNPNPVLRCAASGEVLYANAPGGIMLRTMDAEAGWLPSTLHNAVRTALAMDGALKVQLKAGERVVHWTITPLREEEEALAYGLDITERVVAERAVEQARAELERKVEERTRSLSEEIETRRKTEEALRLASLIVERSPAVLFRRQAGEDPRLVYVSNNIDRFGYSAQEMLSGEVTYRDLVHPDDREMLRQEIDAYYRHGVMEYAQEYRLVTRGGEVRWVHDETTAERDEHGVITHYHGIVVDITERKKATDALALASVIVERSPVVLFRRQAGPESRLVYVSENIARLGYRAGDFLEGRISFNEIVHPEDRVTLANDVETAAEQDLDEYRLSYRVRTAAGETRHIDDLTTVERDAEGVPTHYQGVLNDVTEQVLAREELARSEYKFRRIVETAGEGFILMNEELSILVVNDAYCEMIGRKREDVLGHNPMEWATDQFRAFMVANKEHILAQDTRTFEGSLVAADGRVRPILVHGNILRDEAGELMGHVAFVTDLTEQKKALALAEEVQRSLLPESPLALPGMRVAGLSVSSDEVGGDYLDFLTPLGEDANRLGVVVGDIAGHGVDAALLMTSARALLRMRVARGGPLQAIVADLNQSMFDDMNGSGRFMTLLIVVVDAAAKRLEWVRAGHDPALLYDPATNVFEELKGKGLPLGVDADYPYDANTRASLAAGQLLILGSDGVWEAMNPQGEMFGKERTRDVIRRYADAEPDVIVKNVLNEVYLFVEKPTLEDDVTFAVLRLE